MIYQIGFVILALLALALVILAGILIWCRHTLLKNVATVDVKDVDPALLRKIEQLQLEYNVADELGYPGEVLVHLEAQLNAAKLEASGDANALNVAVIVSPDGSTVQFAPQVIPAAIESLLSTPLTLASMHYVSPPPQPVASMQTGG